MKTRRATKHRRRGGALDADMDVVVLASNVVKNTATVSAGTAVQKFIEQCRDYIWRADYSFDELEITAGKHYIACGMQLGKPATVMLAGYITPQLASKVTAELKKLFTTA